MFPFHPDYPVTEDEIELGQKEFNRIEHVFEDAHFVYYDMLTRSSIVHILDSFGLTRTIKLLKKLDGLLLETIPPLRKLSSQVLIKAKRA